MQQDITQEDIVSVSILCNDGTKSHLKELRSQFKTANEVQMVVAFVSEQGAKVLIDLLADTSGIVTLFTSIERMVSEPSALQSLHDFALISNKLSINVVARRAGNGFTHAKLYHFKQPTHSVTIIGSANLSLGGLVDNNELSTLVVHTADGKFGKDIKTQLVRLCNDATSLTPEMLSRYKLDYESEQNGKHHYEVDPILKQSFLKKRPIDYVQENTKIRILKIQMIAFVDSDGEQKVSEKLISYFPWLDRAYINVIRTIQHHQRLDAENLWQLIETTNSRQAKPLEKSALASIMHLYQPRRFAPVSEVLLDALREKLGMNPVTIESMRARDYKLLCSSLAKLRAELKLKSIGAVATWLLGKG